MFFTSGIPMNPQFEYIIEKRCTTLYSLFLGTISIASVIASANDTADRRNDHSRPFISAG